ncbi:proline iminopeptidase [Nitzschia inconspicua]|uniref:Proline iminopeptidase n=1 Tax=Nitzschia inconspicua TaxID=303405 RepID=A0A9K3M4G3_9STRA|nr:proline iminopeptidase [Nitzschia inconspicua]
MHPSMSLPPPSLCVTGAMSKIGRYTVKNTPGDVIILSYIVFRPRQVHSESHPPLVCLHGGPSIPSNYMLSIVNTVTDRSIIFYDQYGCGKSSRPTIGEKIAPFSIAQHVEHLRQLLHDEWKLSNYHFLGHSWGGILAFEFLKQQQKNGDSNDSSSSSCCCCSLVLSSTPTAASLIESESKRLYQELSEQESADTKKATTTQDDNDDEDDEDDSKLAFPTPFISRPSSSTSSSSTSTSRMASAIHPIASSSLFQQTHECRLPQIPLTLIDSLAQVGPVEWRGLTAIQDWQAEGSIRVPTLILQGEYDFCTANCTEDWKNHISSGFIEYNTLSGCSHFSMLEDERQYGQVVTTFLHQHESPSVYTTPVEASSQSEEPVLLSDLASGTTVRASSVLQKNTKLYGPMNVLDYSNNLSCWNSEGSSDETMDIWLRVDFGRLVRPAVLQLQFQAGFVGETMKILALQNDNDKWTEVSEEEVEDSHDIQSFSIPSTSTTALTAIKLAFDDCTDFYKRITIYELKVLGHEQYHVPS